MKALARFIEDEPETFLTVDDDMLSIHDNPPAEVRQAGGPGSGNFGHSGRPGETGGSAEGDGASVIASKLDAFRERARGSKSERIMAVDGGGRTLFNSAGEKHQVYLGQKDLDASGQRADIFADDDTAVEDEP